MQNQNLKLKFFLWLVVAAGLIYYFARGLQWDGILESFRQMNPTLAAAATIPIMLTYLVRAFRWQAFLAPIGRSSIRNLFAATVIGFSSIFVLGRIGEVIRPVVLSLREPLRPSATVATIMVERLFDSTAVIVAFAVYLAFFGQWDNAHEQLTTVRYVGFGVLIGYGVLLIGLSFFRTHVRSVLDFMETRFGWLPETIHRVMLNLLQHLAEGLYVLHDVKGLLVTGGYTILLWGLVTLSFWLVATSFGLPLSPVSIIFILGFALVGSLVPTPGGSAGAFHTATMVGLTLLGIEQNKAASAAIAMHLVGFGTALIFGIYFLIIDGISFKSLRLMMAQEMGPAEKRLNAQAIGAEP